MIIIISSPICSQLLELDHKIISKQELGNKIDGVSAGKFIYKDLPKMYKEIDRVSKD